jgi:adenylate cyclase
MAIEIERKFLVDGDGWREQVERSCHLRQAYLAGSTTCSVRVRIDGERAWLGLKGRVRGASRLEFEYLVPLADASVMFESLCGGGRIDKLRHIVPWQGHYWEVDEFLGDNSGLVLAELELEREDEVFARPPWLGTEVTLDQRYFNSYLARHPWAGWSAGSGGEPGP